MSLKPIGGGIHRGLSQSRDKRRPSKNRNQLRAQRGYLPPAVEHRRCCNPFGKKLNSTTLDTHRRRLGLRRECVSFAHFGTIWRPSAPTGRLRTREQTLIVLAIARFVLPNGASDSGTPYYHRNKGYIFGQVSVDHRPVPDGLPDAPLYWKCQNRHYIGLMPHRYRGADWHRFKSDAGHVRATLVRLTCLFVCLYPCSHTWRFLGTDA
ncbi:unnamed protein product, partial [Iphiclides podalirius]